MKTLADSVRRIGFRKWYERQLLSSHGHMVIAFISVIGLLGSMEVSRGASGDLRVANLLSVLACAGIAFWALRRYLFLLMRAEETANQASCPDCGDYGRFQVVRHDSVARELEVSCAKCACRWKIGDFR